MKTLKHMAMTAFVSGAIAFSAPAQAEEQQKTWFGNMTETVASWFQPETQVAWDVETYLDEVIVSVPPMSAEDAAAIQPAAGDYQESLEDALENDVQSFNTDFTAQDGDIANAFDDVEALNAIVPAAGDAEEIVDESIVVVEDGVTTTTDSAMEKVEEAETGAVETMEKAVEETVDTTEEAVTDMVHDHMHDH